MSRQKQKSGFTIAEVKVSNRGSGRFQEAFTLIELLVVIAVIAVLMSILMPALQRVKAQARALICRYNMKQWGLMFNMYCEDNETHFFSGEYNGTRVNMGSGKYWRLCMKPYSKDKKMWLCPQATLVQQEGIPVGNWSNVAWEFEGDIGSVGLNGWVLNLAASKDPANTTNGWNRPDQDSKGRSRHWGTPPVKNADNVPLFADMWWVDAWPLETDLPPPVEAGPNDSPNNNEMNRVCVNRHGGFIAALFMDWSGRKVGLKELWTLKWHKTYNTRGPYTIAGGVWPSDWPKWMQKFKDY
jgi:prepilin-type N-terminal cleavage/methylation domain-containing protein